MRVKYLMLWTPGPMCTPDFNGLMACRVRTPQLYVASAVPWDPSAMREGFEKSGDHAHAAAVDERVRWLDESPDSPYKPGKLFTIPSLDGRQFILQWQEDDSQKAEVRQADGWSVPYAMTFGNGVMDPEYVLRLADWTKRLDRASHRLGYGDRGFSIGRPDPAHAVRLIASLGGVLAEEVKGAAGERHLGTLYRMAEVQPDVTKNVTLRA